MSALEADDARIHAALIGWDFDNQIDYCEPCRGYHVGETHDEVVQPQCSAVGMWGHSAVNDCRKAAGHQSLGGRFDEWHCDINGTTWGDVA